ncbi:hypothetical protein ATO6_18800 [Oceanicola sp. 22II-s10i]|nr:hypothetical protein ATO6_18800 [Oceanicola sp. 22II-s10i]
MRTSVSKLVFDKAFALMALTLLFPLLIVIAVVILIADGRPIFYSQARIGQNGRRFRCWKFRTMIKKADAALEAALSKDPELKAEWLATRKLRNDPRINAIGRILRNTSLDELPQFWNVLRGDMSIVGPRPVVPDELSYYGQFAGVYLSVRPGLTGAWQVSGRSNTTYDQRVAMDVEYVGNAGFWRDMSIVVKTVRVVLTRDGAI